MRNQQVYRVSIDPGGTGTGIAFWKSRTWDKLELPVRCEIIEPVLEGEWHEKVCDVAGQIKQLLQYEIISEAYIEQVGYFDSHVGQAAARSESMEKLVTAYGAILYALSFCADKIITIPVNTWKGQLPKKVVENRILSLLPEIKGFPNFSSHAIDAVGIGLYAKGFLK